MKEFETRYFGLQAQIISIAFSLISQAGQQGFPRFWAYMFS